jgi:hypothetical protein
MLRLGWSPGSRKTAQELIASGLAAANEAKANGAWDAPDPKTGTRPWAVATRSESRKFLLLAGAALLGYDYLHDGEQAGAKPEESGRNRDARLSLRRGIQSGRFGSGRAAAITLPGPCGPVRVGVSRSVGAETFQRAGKNGDLRKPHRP